MDEVWVGVPLEENYEVSNLGRVRSLPHIDNRNKPWGGRILKPFRDGNKGYVAVSISKKRVKVHRLVCSCFLGEQVDMQVNHKNGIRDDNRIENLEWCTPRQNVRHSYEQLGRRSAGGHSGKTSYEHHCSKTVVGTHLLTGQKKIFGSTAEAARELGIGSGSIPRCCNGVYKSAGGWEFKYLETGRLTVK